MSQSSYDIKLKSISIPINYQRFLVKFYTKKNGSLSEIMETSIELLKEHRLKVTPQRLKILKMLETEGHLTIDRLYEGMRQEFPNVSLATIYKNINQMADSKLVLEVKIPGGKSVYEIIKAPHLHMVCDKCHKIEDIIVGTDSVIKAAEQASGYIVQESFITLRGICPDCQKNL